MHLLIDDSTMLIQHTTYPKSRKCTKTYIFSLFASSLLCSLLAKLLNLDLRLQLFSIPKSIKKSIENSCKIDSKKQCENEAELGAVFHRFWSHLGTQDGAKIAEKRNPENTSIFHCNRGAINEPMGGVRGGPMFIKFEHTLSKIYKIWRPVSKIMASRILIIVPLASGTFST